MKNLKWSLPLGQMGGIKVYIHWTFLILIGWIFLSQIQMGQNWQQASIAVLFILTLFVCVTLHEFGHALIAKIYRIQTKSITLFPIGGLAQMESLPEKPLQELWVALAGPLVNVVIATGLYVYLFTTDNIPDLKEIAKLDNTYFLFNLFVANVFLAVFNLIPAFPMDGGRVLRALLSFKFNRAKATKIAATVGQILAIGFVFLGIFSNFWLVFIGIFIYLGAGGEAAFEATKIALSGFKVKDALMTRFVTLNTTDTIGRAAQLLLEGQDREFLIQQNNEIVGVVGQSDIITGIKKFGKNSPVTNIARKDFLPLNPEMELQDIYFKMMTNGELISPIFEKGELVGVLDRENISELILIREALKGNTDGN